MYARAREATVQRSPMQRTLYPRRGCGRLPLVRTLLACLLAGVSAGCGLMWRPAYEPAPKRVDPGESAIARALTFLEDRQVTPEQEASWGRDYAGDWPQYIVERGARGILPSVRDVSPFLATFIHDALSLIHEERAASLGLPPEAARRARVLRGRAAGLMRRFELMQTADGDALYAFWPRARGSHNLANRLSALICVWRYRGAVHRGVIAPPNMPSYPVKFRAWADADDTAVIHATLANHARLEDGAPHEARLDRILERWRDDGTHPRAFPDWLESRSGLYLTWLFPDSHRDLTNDVDLVVNANVLYALARLGQRESVPGVAARLVRAIRAGRHRDAPRASKYYADSVLLRWLYARAFSEGPVPALEPAVAILADEVEASAVRMPNGMVYWRGRVSERDTALSVLTLLHANRHGPLVDGGLAWLEQRQNPVDGGWPESVFCEGPTENGLIVEWRSRSFTTAVALEALVRRRLAAP